MPRDYKPTPASRPSGSGAVSAARAGSKAGDLSDALLLGSAHTRNPEPFTAEVRAAYAAFAGITDEMTARRLWREFITWDDVNEYVAAGLSVTDHAIMAKLRRARITPDLWGDWRTQFPEMYDNGLLTLVERMGPVLADPQTYRLFRDLSDTQRRIPTSAQWAPSAFEGLDYAATLSGMRRACETADADYAEAVLVAEALVLNEIHLMGADTFDARGRRKNHRPAMNLHGWAGLLADGMPAARAAAVVYAGVREPAGALEWADRPTSAALAFAALQSRPIPEKVQRLAREADLPVG